MTAVVRDVVNTLNGRQFKDLAGLFSDPGKPLYYLMSVPQAVEHCEAIMQEHPGLLMRLFLSQLLSGNTEGNMGASGAEANTELAKVPRLTFNTAVVVARSTASHYGLKPDQINKALAKQLLRYLDYATRPINLERLGAKITMKTAEEHNASMLRFAGYLVNILGASPDAVSMEHILEQDLVLQYDNWVDCARGAATNSRRKVMQHLCCIAQFALVQFPGLVVGYGDVPDVYRRLVNQLRMIEKQETKSQSDLIREELWLPFPVLVELAASHQSRLRQAVREGESKVECAKLVMEAAVLMLVSRYSWRTAELTSLEIVTSEELEVEARKARLSRSVYLEGCGRNFMVVEGERCVIITSSYKTAGTYRVLEDTLVPEVSTVVCSFIRDHREVLLGGQTHRFAFVGSNGRGLTGTDIADMFERLTGIRLLCNVRRQATVTWALAQQNMDRESLARLMRHSEAMQLKSYDRRSSDAQTGPALSAIGEFASGLKRTREQPMASTAIGDVVTWGGLHRKVVDVGRTLTVVTLAHLGGLKPIFGDAHLLQCFPVYYFVAPAEVKVLRVEYDEDKGVYVIKEKAQKRLTVWTCWRCHRLHGEILVVKQTSDERLNSERASMMLHWCSFLRGRRENTTRDG